MASYRKKRSHQLRYVLRNKTTEEVYLVVLFTLHLQEDVNEDGSIKPEAANANINHGEAPAMETPDEESQTLLSNVKDSSGEAAVEETQKYMSDLSLSTEKDKGKALATQDDDID